MTCWVLITDTRRVWAEGASAVVLLVTQQHIQSLLVLQGRHLSRRASQVLDEPEHVHRTEKQEQRFRRAQLDLVNGIHDLSKIDDMEIEVQSTAHPYAVGTCLFCFCFLPTSCLPFPLRQLYLNFRPLTPTLLTLGSMHENNDAHSYLALGRIRTPSFTRRRNPL